MTENNNHKNFILKNVLNTDAPKKEVEEDEEEFEGFESLEHFPDDWFFSYEDEDTESEVLCIECATKQMQIDEE